MSDRIAGPIETWVRNPKNIVGVTHLVERGARRGHTECGDSCKVIKFAREQDKRLADADAEIAHARRVIEFAAPIVHLTDDCDPPHEGRSFMECPRVFCRNARAATALDVLEET